MSGWCPSSSVCAAVEWRWCVLLLSRPVSVVQPVPYSSHCSTGEYCCRVAYCYLPGVWCVGGVCSVCGVCAVGYPLCVPPSRWWRVGLSWMVGWHCSGGWHSFGRAGGVTASLPYVCWCPPFVCVVAVLNGGGGIVRWGVPVFGLGAASCVVLLLLCYPTLQCVCCHSIVGLGVCLCDRGVLLRNGGGVMGVISLPRPLSSSLSSSSSLCWCSG